MNSAATRSGVTPRCPIHGLSPEELARLLTVWQQRALALRSHAPVPQIAERE